MAEHRATTARETTTPAATATPTTTPTTMEQVEPEESAPLTRGQLARRRFGGTNWGACFFGWLVAIALTILLTSIIGAVLAAVGSTAHVTQDDAQRQAGTLGLATAITLFVVLVLGYYAGGYVAGRMSRFDGSRQGLGVWLIGLAVTVLALALGAAFGHQYNLLDRVDLPRIPVSTEQLGWGALVTAAAVLIGTALAAMVGGAVGRRYHARVDNVVLA
jgi:MFS family permease